MAEELILKRPEQRAASPTMRDVLAVLFRQQRVVRISFCVALAAALLYWLVTPRYEAHMKVLVSKGRIDPAVTPTPTQTPQLGLQEVSEEELNSEVELLRDDEILRTVAEASGLLQERHWWDLGGDDLSLRVALAARRLAGRLRVERVPKTKLIQVTYRSSDPKVAEVVLKCLAQAYLARHERLRRPANEFDFFDQQVAEAREELLATGTRVEQFSKREGVVSAASERDLWLRNLSDAENQDHLLGLSLSETGERISALEGTLKRTPARRTNEIKSSDNPQLLEKLKSRLLELQLRRTELLTKFLPSYRLVQEVDEQIAATQATITAERLTPVIEQTSQYDPAYDWAQSELDKAQVEMRGLQARAAAAHSIVAQYRNTAHHFGDEAIQQDNLLRVLKAAEDKYFLYLNKREEARIGDALDQRGIVNAALAEEPTAPVFPVTSTMSFAFLSLGLAGAFATGMGFAADYLDPALRTPAEVLELLDTPVLASLPRRSGSRV
jgi:uncharacterized protein involved in exopolysaccharide biosynthesis